MTSIHNSTARQTTENDSKASEVPAEQAWLQLRDLISPRRHLRLPVNDEI